MAEKVVGFKIQFEGTKELKTVSELFEALSVSIEKANTNLKELNEQLGSKKGLKGVKDLDSSLKKASGSADAMKDILSTAFKGFDEGSKAQQELNKNFDTTGKSVQELIARNKVLKKVLQSVPEDGSEAYENLRKEFTANDKAIKSFNRQLRTGVKETKAKEGSILDLRQKLKQAKADYLALSEAERQSAEGTALRKKIQGLDKDIKGLEESTGDFRRSVGNYARAAEGFDTATGGLLTTARTWKRELQSQGAALRDNVVLLRNNIKQNGLLAVAKGGVTKAMRVLNLVFKASPIGLIVAAFAALATFLTKNQKGMDALKKAMAGVNAVIDVLVDRISLVGEALADLFSGDFSAASDKLSASVSGLNEELQEEVRLAVELESRLQQLTKDTGAFQVEQARLTNQIAKSKLVAEDETKTFEERIAALQDAFKLEEQIANKQQALLRERIILNIKGGDSAKTEAEAQKLLNEVIAGNTKLQLENIGASNSTQEELDDTNRLVAELIDAQTQQFTNQKSELAKINSLERKAEADRKKAVQARIKAEKEKNKKLADERAKFRSELEKDSEARLKIIEQLTKQIGKATIGLIEDETKRQIEAEKDRSKQTIDQLSKNLQDQIKAIDESNEKIKAAFDEGDSERTKALEKNEAERKQLIELSNKAIELEEKQHQENLKAIQKEVDEKKKEDDKKRFEEEVARIESEFKVRELKRQELIARGQLSEKEAEQQAFEDRRAQLNVQLGFLAEDEIEARQRILTELAQLEKEHQDKIAEIQKQNIKDRFELVKQTLSFTQQGIGIIDQFLTASFESDLQKLDKAIQTRQESLSKLEQDIEDATGLEKKFLQQRLGDEQAALEEQERNKELLEKKEAKRRKAFAITQATINGALAITQQLATFKVDPVGINDAIQIAFIVATTAAQIAAISAQKFAKGGVIEGASHAFGGVPIAGGTAEVEGGEAIINKRSTAMFKPLLSAINQAGGGIKFANGGILGAPISAPSQFISDATSGTKALTDIANSLLLTNSRIDNISVSLDVNNLNDINKNASNLEAQTEF